MKPSFEKQRALATTTTAPHPACWLAAAMVLLLALVPHQQAQAFSPNAIHRRTLDIKVGNSDSNTAVWSTPPRRTARRDLQKRKRRRNKAGGVSIPAVTGPTNNNNNENSGTTIAADEEIRPLIAAEARAQGADYWMDETELQRYQESQARRRQKSPGQISDQKLWQEVLSPYKQNWIGWVSVVIVMITTIIVKFPTLLQSPVIAIPDL